MLNCATATNLPLNLPGEISAMYIGAITEAAPIANPPKSLEKRSVHHPFDNAHPRAEMKYNAPQIKSMTRLPRISPGLPTAIDPITVPHKAIDTVTPRVASVRLKCCVMNFVVPEITAVSKPNRKLPNADTIVANRRFLFIVSPTI
jgi:hypothetical protein